MEHHWDALDDMQLNRECDEFFERYADELTDDPPTIADVAEAAQRMEMFEARTQERGQRYMSITTERFDHMAAHKFEAEAEAKRLQEMVNELEAEAWPLRALCLILAACLGVLAVSQ